MTNHPSQAARPHIVDRILPGTLRHTYAAGCVVLVMWAVALAGWWPPAGQGSFAHVAFYLCSVWVGCQGVLAFIMFVRIYYDGVESRHPELQNRWLPPKHDKAFYLGQAQRLMMIQAGVMFLALYLGRHLGL